MSPPRSGRPGCTSSRTCRGWRSRHPRARTPATAAVEVPVLGRCRRRSSQAHGPSSPAPVGHSLEQRQAAPGPQHAVISRSARGRSNQETHQQSSPRRTSPLERDLLATPSRTRARRPWRKTARGDSTARRTTPNPNATSAASRLPSRRQGPRHDPRLNTELGASRRSPPAHTRPPPPYASATEANVCARGWTSTISILGRRSPHDREAHRSPRRPLMRRVRRSEGHRVAAGLQDPL